MVSHTKRHGICEARCEEELVGQNVGRDPRYSSDGEACYEGCSRRQGMLARQCKMRIYGLASDAIAQCASIGFEVDGGE